MVSLASKGLSSLPNEVIHHIAQLSEHRFHGRSANQIRCDPLPVIPYHLSPHATLDFIIKCFNKGYSFVPIPMLGPVRFIFTFDLPRWWSTARGITGTELYEAFPSHSSVRRIDLYMIDLARLTPRQVSSVYKSDLCYDIQIASHSDLYDSMSHLRSSPFDTLYTAPGLYYDGSRVTSVNVGAEFYVFNLTDNALAYYRSKGGVWHTLVSGTVSDIFRKPISTFSLVERECKYGDVIRFYWIKRNYLLSTLGLSKKEEDVHADISVIRSLPKCNVDDLIRVVLQAAILEGFDIEFMDDLD